MQNYKILEFLKDCNNESIEQIRKDVNYIPFCAVDYQMEISLCDYDLEKLLKLHEENKFAFNINCLKYHRNSVIIYLLKEKAEKTKELLKTALREPSRSTYFIEESQSKNRVINRSERGYRKQIYMKFLPNLSLKDKRLLTSFFDVTSDQKFLLSGLGKPINTSEKTCKCTNKTCKKEKYKKQKEAKQEGRILIITE